jgi:threonine dehydratase
VSHSDRSQPVYGQPGARKIAAEPARGGWRLPTLDELEDAASLVYRYMPPTPQYRWPLLDALAGTEVWLKHENHTPVGAFKIRGGIVYMDRLKRERPEIRGVVGATRGNHGQSIGFAATLTGTTAIVIVPRGNSPEKNAAMRALGVQVIVEGADFQESCEFADALAQDRGMHRLPSLAPELVAGVGTYALEFFRGAPALDVVYVPVGMGSGICGMMAARDALGLKTCIVGVVSSGAPAYKLSFEAGRKIEHDVTTILADGLACRSPNEDCLDAMLKGVERVVAVDEDEVANAMRGLFTCTHNVAEGAGAASLAALLQEREAMQGRRVGVVLCGGNVDAEMFARVLAG